MLDTAQIVLRYTDRHLQEFLVSADLLGTLWKEDRLAEWALGNLEFSAQFPPSHKSFASTSACQGLC